jgi:hypothetical protein
VKKDFEPLKRKLSATPKKKSFKGVPIDGEYL